MSLQMQLRKLAVGSVIALLVIISFIVLRPILLSIIAGLILAYAFFPLYRRIYKIFREPNTSALAVCVLIVLIIFIPLWFVIPLVVQQAFEAFSFFQTLDVNSFIQTLFPTSTEQFQQELAAIVYNFIGNVTSSALALLTGFLLDLPNALLHTAVIVFVFFFSLRDAEKLKAFIAGISPFTKEKERILVRKFKELTSSIVFGYILVGIIQGVATGIGLLIFGAPQPLVLTILAIFASILPVVGPWLVWIPAAIFLFASGSTGAAIGFAIYSIAFVSIIDNILRPYIVSRKTGVHQVIVLVGMIGGLLVFGIMGIILGPLILAYLILFLEAYKNKTLMSMFHGGSK